MSVKNAMNLNVKKNAPILEMKKLIQRFSLLLLLLISNLLFSQKNMEDVVYLKNESVIRGSIIEQIPNQSIKIQTKDGSIYAFKMEEILKITKETPVKQLSYKPEKTKRGYIATSIGAAIPSSDFGSNDRRNGSAGYAKKTGFTFNVATAYKLHEYFGVIALFYGLVNGIDEKSKANQFDSPKPEGYYIETHQSNPWLVGGLMGGGYCSYPIHEKWSIETRVLIGFSAIVLPDFTVKFTNPDTSDVYIIKERSTTETTFSYMMGLGLKYDVGNRICLLTNIDYIGASPEFKNVTTVDNYSSSSRSYTQSFGTVNIGVGIGYRL